ncbi:unnamed protein product [Fraxinus pennsylvanica]|uniref:Uncharacterized protein n=1 Tax=Fraxinus pennsylvanica TaxID=56036 RepID=A0AAD1Z8X0_9LAMI|nr:unnamed protein product [Fraxinus pennsylvanica]
MLVSLTCKCSVRGELGPACNSAGMIDRYVLGIDHLYAKPVYRNLKPWPSSKIAPSWCHAPFDPEGILSSLTTAVTCELHHWTSVWLHSCTVAGISLVTSARVGITFCIMYAFLSQKRDSETIRANHVRKSLPELTQNPSRMSAEIDETSENGNTDHDYHHHCHLHQDYSHRSLRNSQMNSHPVKRLYHQSNNWGLLVFMFS